MPSSRRVKLFAAAAITTLLLILYLRSASSYSDDQSRYLKALVDISDRERLLRQQHESLVPPADHSQDLTDKAGVAERLKTAEDAAKKAAADKAGPKPDSPRRVEESRKAKTGAAKEEQEEDAGEAYDPLVEIAAYLKRAPIVIFSKSYCPYSQRAKLLLLETYNIVPAPLVVELDQHAHGAELQAALGRQTGRRTVPNIMVAGKSIGGCDDVYALEEEGALHDTIKKLAGKRVRSVARLVRG
ncbi:thioredoxin-like protein [Morchella snyderi]|nr:thioredoxin-like protein [Morchella snyderi]